MSAKSELLDKAINWCGGAPWERAAYEAIERGRFRIVPNRSGEGLYLARFWLTPPIATQDGEIESGGSILLHHIAAADTDSALHDHPWDFTARVLSGGYLERRPVGPASLDAEGPRETYRTFHNVGDEMRRYARDLHLIESVLPDTWTLVTTGAREREWGFHPAGEPWVPWRKFLGIEA